MKKPSLLAVLLVLLAVVGAIAVVRFAPQVREKAIVGGVQQRLQVSSALRRAVLETQRRTGEWPQDISDIADHPELEPVRRHLAHARYDLQQVEDQGARYRFEFDGRTQEVLIPVRGDTSLEPRIASPAGAGG